MTGEEKTATHAQRALVALRKRILGGELAGGTRLYEVALAEELGISRTPVRAALSVLAEESLLDRGAGGGFVVRSFAVRDVVDTIELRGVLEGTAARMAAERGVPDSLMARGPAICWRNSICSSSGMPLKWSAIPV
jgi:GntR family transcriptional regulator, vanillate catabolism transcriptional regulator